MEFKDLEAKKVPMVNPDHRANPVPKGPPAPLDSTGHPGAAGRTGPPARTASLAPTGSPAAMAHPATMASPARMADPDSTVNTEFLDLPVPKEIKATKVNPVVRATPESMEIPGNQVFWDSKAM